MILWFYQYQGSHYTGLGSECVRSRWGFCCSKQDRKVGTNRLLSAWLNMNDDGINGINLREMEYILWIQREVLSGTWAHGNKIRATDIYQSMTPLEEQNRRFTRQRRIANSSSWLEVIPLLAVLAAALLTMGASGR